MVSRNSSPEEGEQFCKSCGEIITKLSEFCPKCGINQSETFNGEQVSNRPRTITKVIWIIVSFVIPLIGIGAGLKYLFTKNRRKYGCLLFFLGILSVAMWGGIIGSDSETSQPMTTKISIPTKNPQQIKAVAVDIGYDPLYRNIETHIGKIIHLRGKAVQVSIVGGDRYNLRLAMDGDYDQIVWVKFKGERVLEDDTVEIWGTVEGLYSYKSVLGAKITLPEINSLIGIVGSTEAVSNSKSAQKASHISTSPPVVAPTPTSPPVVAPTPIALSGSGQSASEMFTLGEGLHVAKIKGEGGGHFSIWLMNKQGKNVELLVNKIGQFDGSKAFSIVLPGDYILDVDSDGKWEVEIWSDFTESNESFPLSMNGDNQTASKMFRLEKGLYVAKITREGGGHFSIWLMNEFGALVELLVNEIGPYDGSTAFGIDRDFGYILDVSSDGKWSITIEKK